LSGSAPTDCPILLKAFGEFISGIEVREKRGILC